MSQELLIQVSEIALLIAALVGLIIIVRASVYDLRTISQRRFLGSVIATLRKPRQPHITVMAYITDQAPIGLCLDSLRRSRYRNYDIVVVDNAPTGTTRRTVTEYIQHYPKLPLYYYRTRKPSDQKEALLRAYTKSQKGDFVLALKATSIVQPTFLKAAVSRFVADSNLQALRLNEHTIDIQGITVLASRFLQLSRHMYEKFITQAGASYTTNRQLGTVYRSSMFKRRHIKKIPYRYDSELSVSLTLNNRLAVSTEPLLYWHIVAFAVIAFFITYFLFVAASLQSSSLLILSWLVVTIWLTVSVWSDEPSRLSEKIVLTFCIAPFYFLLYIQLAIHALFGIAKKGTLQTTKILQSMRVFWWLPARRL